MNRYKLLVGLFVLVTNIGTLSCSRDDYSLDPATIVGAWEKQSPAIYYDPKLGEVRSDFGILFFAVEHGVPKYGFYFKGETCHSISEYKIEIGQFVGETQTGEKLKFTLARTNESMDIASSELIDKDGTSYAKGFLSGNYRRISPERVDARMKDLGICQNYARSN